MNNLKVEKTMVVTLTGTDLHNLKIFLKRVQLQGHEALNFVHILDRLEHAEDAPPPEITETELAGVETTQA